VVAPCQLCPDLRARTPGSQPLAQFPEEPLKPRGDDKQECPGASGRDEAVAGAPGHEHKRSSWSIELLGTEHKPERAVEDEESLVVLPVDMWGRPRRTAEFDQLEGAGGLVFGGLGSA